MQRRYGSKLLGKAGGEWHHIIPKAPNFLKNYGSDLSNAGFDVNLNNLIDLPKKFHVNAPAYQKYVERELDAILSANGGTLPISEIHQLQNRLVNKINEAYDDYLKTGNNLSEFFKQQTCLIISPN